MLKSPVKNLQNIGYELHIYIYIKKHKMEIWLLFYFQVRESPAPLNILPTPTLHPTTFLSSEFNCFSWLSCFSWLLDFNVSWFQNFSVSWFHSVLGSGFRSFKVSKFQKFFVFCQKILIAFQNAMSGFLKDIDPIAKVFKNLLDGSSDIFDAHFSNMFNFFDL